MKTGATGIAETVMVRELVAASGATVLLAATVKVLEPTAVSVPDKTPSLASSRPAGSVPDPTENVGVGLPVAVNV